MKNTLKSFLYWLGVFLTGAPFLLLTIAVLTLFVKVAYLMVTWLW